MAIRFEPIETSLAGADWTLIPDHLRYSLRAYAERGRVPGPFLTAILMNDGHEMVTRAPKLTLAELRAIVAFCDAYLPRECFGRPEKVADWEYFGGMQGLLQTARTGGLRA
jgi:hypothetical protein